VTADAVEDLTATLYALLGAGPAIVAHLATDQGPGAVAELDRLEGLWDTVAALREGRRHGGAILAVGTLLHTADLLDHAGPSGNLPRSGHTWGCLTAPL